MTLAPPAPNRDERRLRQSAERSRRRGSRNVEAFLEQVWALDVLFQEHGFPGLSDWWKDTIAAAYRSGRRRIVIRKGRRIGASTIVAPLLAIAEAIFGDHQHTTGAPPLMLAFLSVKRSEAANRLRGITARLDALGVTYTVRGDTIELQDRPFIFAVMTASFRLAVGETVCWTWCDEVARWFDDDGSANPAEQVVSSLVPALATMPNATIWLVSSPLTIVDYHARCFDRGDDETQVVFHTPTWGANPLLTEADTRELEPDEDAWQREYAAVPSAETGAVIAQEDYDAAEQRELPEDIYTVSPGYVMAIDASSLRGDGFAWLLARWRWPNRLFVERETGNVTRNVREVDGGTVVTTHRETEHVQIDPQPVLEITHVDAWRGDALRTTSMDAIVRRLAQIARNANVTTIFGDQREEAALRSMFMDRGIWLRSYAWNLGSKDDAITSMKRFFREGRIKIPANAELRRQTLTLQWRVTPSGRWQYQTTGRDELSALVTLFHAINDGAASEFYQGRYEAPAR